MKKNKSLVVLGWFGFFLVIGISSYYLSKNNQSHSERFTVKVNRIPVINGPASLGKGIAVKLSKFDPPLLMEGTRVVNLPSPEPEWLALHAKLMAPCLIDYKDYKNSVTSDYLNYSGLIDENIFNSKMDRLRPIYLQREPIESSVVWSFEVLGDFGNYLWVVEWSGSHLEKINQIENNVGLTYSLYKKDGPRFYLESPKMIENIGLNKIPYSDLIGLENIEGASSLDGSGRWLVPVGLNQKTK